MDKNIQNSDASQLPSVIAWQNFQETLLGNLQNRITKKETRFDIEMRNYINKVRVQVYTAFRSPQTAIIMGGYVSDALRFFDSLMNTNMRDQVDPKTYYHDMTELLAMYLDLKVNSLLLYKERLEDVRQQFFCMCQQYFNNCIDLMTNTLLQVQRLKVNRHLFEPIFKHIELKLNSDLIKQSNVQYCRYILFYRQWKKMYSDITVLREISGRGEARLHPPTNFRQDKLFEMLRPKNVPIPPNITLFFLTAAIHTTSAVEKFFAVYKDESQFEDPDEVVEVVDLTDDPPSPKREKPQSKTSATTAAAITQQQSTLTLDRFCVPRTPANLCRADLPPVDDTYNLTVSFNNAMNIESSKSSTILSSPRSTITSSVYRGHLDGHHHHSSSGSLQRPTWSPISRTLNHSSKEHQESIDTGIFSDRSSGNSPAYEMEMKDVLIPTSTPQTTTDTDRGCDKCGHKPTPVVPPKVVAVPKPPSDDDVIVILDDEEETKSRANVDQVIQQDIRVMEQQLKLQQNLGNVQEQHVSVHDQCTGTTEPSAQVVEPVATTSENHVPMSVGVSTSSPAKETSTCDVEMMTTPVPTIKVNTTSELNIKCTSVSVNTDDVVLQTDPDDNRTLTVVDPTDKGRKSNVKDVAVSTDDIIDNTQYVNQIISDNRDIRVVSVENVTPLIHTGVGTTSDALDESVRFDSDAQMLDHSTPNLVNPPTSSSGVCEEMILPDLYQPEATPNEHYNTTTTTPTVVANNVPTIEACDNACEPQTVDNTAMTTDDTTVDSDLDTQTLVDQMFCSKPIQTTPKKPRTKQQKPDLDKNHCELTTYLKSPPQSDHFFYGFKAANQQQVSSLPHNQCTIHLQNITRKTEQMLSSSAREKKASKQSQSIGHSDTSNSSTSSTQVKPQTKSILKTSKKPNTAVKAVHHGKKSVVLSNDSLTRYILDEDDVGQTSTPKKSSGSSASPTSALMQMIGQTRKHGSIIIAENHYDKPEAKNRRDDCYQDYRRGMHRYQPHQHLYQDRRVLRQRSESRDRDPFSQYLHPSLRDSYQQPAKERENTTQRRRARSRSVSERNNEVSTRPSKRARNNSTCDENMRVTRSRSRERLMHLEMNDTNVPEFDTPPPNRVSGRTRSRSRSNSRKRDYAQSEEEKQALYEALRRKYYILREVQIILNQTNSMTLQSYQKKLAEQNVPEKKLGTQKQRRKSLQSFDDYIEAKTKDNSSESQEYPEYSYEFEEHVTPTSSSRAARYSRRNSNINDTTIYGRRRGRSLTRTEATPTRHTAFETDGSEMNNEISSTTPQDHLTPPSTPGESMYPSSTYFSTPVRIPDFVECLQSSYTQPPQSNEIRVPSIQSSIERLQNSLASPISLPTENTDLPPATDAGFNIKKFNSIKSGNLMKPIDRASPNGIQISDVRTLCEHNAEDEEEFMEFNEIQLRSKGARKDESQRPMRQCRRSNSASNRIFSTDTSSTRRLRKSEYLKTFRHVTGDLEEEVASSPQQTDSSSPSQGGDNTKTSEKLSWEHYIKLSPDKQQVSIVDTHDEEEDDENLISSITNDNNLPPQPCEPVVLHEPPPPPPPVFDYPLNETAAYAYPPPPYPIISIPELAAPTPTGYMSYPARPMMSIAELDQLQSIEGIAHANSVYIEPITPVDQIAAQPLLFCEVPAAVSEDLSLPLCKNNNDALFGLNKSDDSSAVNSLRKLRKFSDLSVLSADKIENQFNEVDKKRNAVNSDVFSPALSVLSHDKIDNQFNNIDKKREVMKHSVLSAALSDDKSDDQFNNIDKKREAMKHNVLSAALSDDKSDDQFNNIDKKRKAMKNDVLSKIKIKEVLNNDNDKKKVTNNDVSLSDNTDNELKQKSINMNSSLSDNTIDDKNQKSIKSDASLSKQKSIKNDALSDCVDNDKKQKSSVMSFIETLNKNSDNDNKKRKNDTKRKTVVKNDVSANVQQSDNSDKVSKLRLVDMFEEYDNAKVKNNYIPNVRKRRLLSCSTLGGSEPNTTTTTTNSTTKTTTNSAIKTTTNSTTTTMTNSVIKTTTNSGGKHQSDTTDDDEDDNISLAELIKKRNLCVVNHRSRRNAKTVQSKRSRLKHCDVLNLSLRGGSTVIPGKAGLRGRSTIGGGGGIGSLTLDEIETCDISVVSCEEVVGEGTISLGKGGAVNKTGAAKVNTAASTGVDKSLRVSNPIAQSSQ